MDSIDEISKSVEEKKNSESPTFFSKTLNGDDHTDPAKEGCEESKN